MLTTGTAKMKGEEVIIWAEPEEGNGKAGRQKQMSLEAFLSCTV